MTLLDVRGGYLYEHKPSLFPEGEISGCELLLWEMYYYEKAQRQPKR